MSGPRKKYNIEIIHTDGCYSWLNAGFKVEVTEWLGERLIATLRRMDQFKGAKFNLVPVP